MIAADTTYLIAGAAGNVGGEVVRALAESNASVRGLVRRDSAVLPPGVDTVVGDLNDPVTIREGARGAQAAFVLAGYRDMPGLFRELGAAGVMHVVLLSAGAVVGGEHSNVVTAYNMDSEDAVRASGLTWTILRPSGFMSNALQWRDQLRDGDVVREAFADVQIAVIDPADIAACAVVSLDGGVHRGQAYRLTGPAAMTPRDRLRVLAEILGRDLRLEAKSDEQARADMLAAMPSAYAEAFMRYFADGTYDDSIVLPTVGDLLGRPPRTFDLWVRAHGHEFSGVTAT